MQNNHVVDSRSHLGAEFLHGNLGVVKHLKLLLESHLGNIFNDGDAS